MSEQLPDAEIAKAVHDSFCWAQPPDGRQIACDRAGDHQGGHSWEIAEHAREQLAKLADEAKAWYCRGCFLSDDQHGTSPFGELIRTWREDYQIGSG
jgi:hypothetical protein